MVVNPPRSTTLQESTKVTTCPPVLFLFVIQAFLDTLNLKIQPVQFAYFPENKNSNLATIKGRLLSQDTFAKGTPLSFNTSFYVDDSSFLFSTKEELQQAIESLDKHSARFGLPLGLRILELNKTQPRKTCFLPSQRHPPNPRHKLESSLRKAHKE